MDGVVPELLAHAVDRDAAPLVVVEQRELRGARAELGQRDAE